MRRPAWIRRLIGPSRAELRAEVAMWRGRCERSNEEARDAHRRRKQVIKAWRAEVGPLQLEIHNLSEQLRNARQKLALSAEPPRREGCDKVRLHRREEAERWAEQIEQGTGGEPGELCVYPCKICPRSPVTMQRYWHAGHPGSEQGQAAKHAGKARRTAERVSAGRSGLTVAQRVDPRVMERLRQIGGDRA